LPPEPPLRPIGAPLYTTVFFAVLAFILALALLLSTKHAEDLQAAKAPVQKVHP
jgi:hypothetical protein